MELDSVFLSRHSFREYQDKDISHEIISEILDAAKYAPSAGNMQNWNFIVIRDKKKMTKLAEACLNQYWISQAPILIVVCYDERSVKILFPEKTMEFSLQNNAIATTYLILKATELGLGTCWVDIVKKDESASLLKLPSHTIPTHLIALGYPKGTPKKTRKNDSRLVTFFEEYGNKKIDNSIFPLQKQFGKLKNKIKKKN